MKIVILGGGPSGLGVAWGLVEKGYRDIVVVERNPQLGGLSGSFTVGLSTLDFGPHRFSPEYPELVKKIKDILGEELLEVSNEHAVVFKDRVYRYPPVLSDFLNVPTFWTSFRVVTSFFWERIKYGIRRASGKKDPEKTFENVIVSRFGRVLYEQVVRPLSNKVWGDPKTLDPEFANLRFSVPTVVQWWKKLIGHSDTFNDKVFFYPKQGFQQLWDRLGDHLRANGVEIMLNAQATALCLEGSRVTSVTIASQGAKREIPTDWVVSTIPTQHFVRLLKPNPLSPAELLMRKFTNRGMILAYFLVKKPQSLPARVVVFPESKWMFNRLSEQNQFSRITVPEGKSAVLVDVLTEVNTEMWNSDDTGLIQKIAKQIESCGFFSESEIEEAKIFRVPIAYPLPTIDREQEQQKFNEAIAQVGNILCTGRFASSDYNNSHTALNKGLMAAGAIAAMQASSEWYRMSEKIRKVAIRD